LGAKREVGLTLNNLGAASARHQQLSEAVRYYNRAIAIHQELVRLAPAHRVHPRDLAISHNNLGLIHSRQQQTKDAEREFRQALTLQHSLVQDHPDDLALQSSLGGVHNNMGILLEESGQLEQAAGEFAQAINHQRIAWEKAPEVARFREFLSKHYFNYGRVARQLGKLDVAADVAHSRRNLWPGSAEHLFSVAEEFAQIYNLLAANSASLSQEECATLVVETLQQAGAAGWQLPPDLARRPHFASLQQKSPQFVHWMEKAL
jgi:tetratricopeptide (TPR) repeat protein